jgi:hypothetical protein
MEFRGFVDSEGSFRVIPINEKKNFWGLDLK